MEHAGLRAPGSITTTRRSSAVYKTLADFMAATGQEKHGVLVDYDSFMHVTPPNMQRSAACL